MKLLFARRVTTPPPGCEALAKPKNRAFASLVARRLFLPVFFVVGASCSSVANPYSYDSHDGIETESDSIPTGSDSGDSEGWSTGVDTGVSETDGTGGSASACWLIDTVVVPDEPLAEALRQKLGVAEGGLISCSPLAALLDFSASDLGIESLTGLEFATGLRSLRLDNNFITDLGPLTPLTELQNLILASNFLGNIDALRGLPNLVNLDLRDNWFESLQPLVENSNFGLGASLLLGPYDGICSEELSAHIQILIERGVNVSHDCF